MIITMTANNPNDAAGIWKLEVMCLSMEFAWSIGNVLWLTLIETMIPVDHNGITLISAFSSSTCSAVQRLQGFEADPSWFMSTSGSLMMQALFKSLKRKKARERLLNFSAYNRAEKDDDYAGGITLVSQLVRQEASSFRDGKVHRSSDQGREVFYFYKKLQALVQSQ